MPRPSDLPDDLDPSHYIRGAKAAGEFLGGKHPKHRTQVQHWVREGRLHSWSATAILGSHAREGDRIYYIPELTRFREELAAEQAAEEDRSRREAERAAEATVQYQDVEERDKLIFDLVAAGLNGAEIGRRLGLSRQRVSQILMERGDRPIGGGVDRDSECVTQAS